MNEAVKELLLNGIYETLYMTIISTILFRRKNRWCYKQ